LIKLLLFLFLLINQRLDGLRPIFDDFQLIILLRLKFLKRLR